MTICRTGCAACCIAPSISSLAKPAGIPCRHLDMALRCSLYGLPERPECCSGLQPAEEMCGNSRDAAIAWLVTLEAATAPPLRLVRPSISRRS
ncbi:MAG: YkgJ family cysteine cluster protein [Rhodocyclaceae bacterium]|nr:MAG: YkgJ family cysteine cluster protein [Rhodocyclaceae bacterium]